MPSFEVVRFEGLPRWLWWRPEPIAVKTRKRRAEARQGTGSSSRIWEGGTSCEAAQERAGSGQPPCAAAQGMPIYKAKPTPPSAAAASDPQAGTTKPSLASPGREPRHLGRRVSRAGARAAVSSKTQFCRPNPSPDAAAGSNAPECHRPSAAPLHGRSRRGRLSASALGRAPAPRRHRAARRSGWPGGGSSASCRRSGETSWWRPAPHRRRSPRTARAPPRPRRLP